MQYLRKYELWDTNMYNPDKATHIGEYNNGEMPNSFNYYSETLYRKNNGEFFLLIDGIRKKNCGSYITDCKIEKIDVEQAKE